MRKETYLIIFLVLAIIASHGYFWYELYQAKQVRLANEAEIAAKNDELASKEMLIQELSGQLSMTEEELKDTADRLNDEKDRNDEMEDRVNDLAGTVSDLDKLSKTDEELLQKYSKVYFLNEHYIPDSLRQIEDQWKYDESRDHELHSKVVPFFEDMMEDALDDGVELWVVSSYRSFEYQSQLKGSYTVTYGSGANAFSADQGYSEHQLGTAIDFTTKGLNGGLEGFGSTAAYEWLLSNAHKYGFTLSYPQNNTYYVFEPWHWRFVGTELAEDLHDAGAHFYDWDQRKINAYLLNIFD